MYSYTPPDQVVKKRLRVARTLNAPYPYSPTTVQQDLDGSWTYDNEGKMTAVTYPAANGVAGASYSFGYDAMSRPQTMTDVPSAPSVITGVTYGPANELLTITGAYSESRAYNSRLQLTQLNGVSFAYPASQNNGKIQSQTNAATAETVTYQYDALNRLISAVTTDNPSVPQWGQQFVYDGFGTLTGKNVIKGSAPVWGGTGVYSDANGNQLTDAAGVNTLQYDVENRLTWGQKGSSSPGVGMGYDPDNRRVYKSLWSYDMTNGWSLTGEEITYYGVTGQRMGAYTLQATPQTQYSPASLTLTTAGINMYFGAKLIGKSPNNDGSGRTIVSQDRLGSVGQYYPYGEQKGTATPNNTDKFATYYRDAELGFDYAMNRYYDPVRGRFLTADPYQASAGAEDPESWNRSAYVEGDPANFTDPTGLLTSGLSPGLEIDIMDFNIDDGFYPIYNAWGPVCSVPAIGNQLSDALGALWTQIGTCTMSGPTPDFEIAVPLASLGKVGFGSAFQPIAGAATGTAGTIILAGQTIGWESVIMAGGPAVILTGVTIGVGYLIYQSINKKDTFPTVDSLRAGCSTGRFVSVPATGIRYRGATSNEQEYICANGTYTVHWIERDGKILHGPHVRPGSPKGNGGD